MASDKDVMYAEIFSGFARGLAGGLAARQQAADKKAERDAKYAMENRKLDQQQRLKYKELGFDEYGKKLELRDLSEIQLSEIIEKGARSENVKQDNLLRYMQLKQQYELEKEKITDARKKVEMQDKIDTLGKEIEAIRTGRKIEDGKITPLTEPEKTTAEKLDEADKAAKTGKTKSEQKKIDAETAVIPAESAMKIKKDQAYIDWLKKRGAKTDKGGRDLTQKDRDSIDMALNFKSEMDNISNMFEENPNRFGLARGLLNKVDVLQLDPGADLMKGKLEGISVTLAGLRQSGVLTDQDIANAKKEIPRLTDRPTVVRMKISNLKNIMKNALKRKGNILKASGFDYAALEEYVDKEIKDKPKVNPIKDMSKDAQIKHLEDVLSKTRSKVQQSKLKETIDALKGKKPNVGK